MRSPSSTGTVSPFMFGAIVALAIVLVPEGLRGAVDSISLSIGRAFGKIRGAYGL